MEFLIPIAVLLQIEEIDDNFQKVADDDGSYNKCKWYYCNFDNTCGSNISQELNNFMNMTLTASCVDEFPSFSCDQCNNI